jgi:hypothetical protein
MFKMSRLVSLKINEMRKYNKTIFLEALYNKISVCMPSKEKRKLIYCFDKLFIY